MDGTFCSCVFFWLEMAGLAGFWVVRRSRSFGVGCRFCCVCNGNGRIEGGSEVGLL